jgi:hypothetical protein
MQRVSTFNTRGGITVKKGNAELSKGRSDQKSDKLRKRGSARAPQRAVDGLTCSEAQVEALLSEGEST